MQIQSAVLPQYTTRTDRPTDRQTHGIGDKTVRIPACAQLILSDAANNNRWAESACVSFLPARCVCGNTWTLTDDYTLLTKYRPEKRYAPDDGMSTGAYGWRSQLSNVFEVAPATASLPFRPLPYGHTNQWVRLPLWGFLQVTGLQV